MASSQPNFSPYPIALVRRLTAADAVVESAIARWIGGRALGPRVDALAGGVVRVVGIEIGPTSRDPFPARAEVRYGGMSIRLAAGGRPIRALVQRLLGGPVELDAPRPLVATEHAVWALVIAAAVEDAGVGAEVWPVLDADVATDPDAAVVEVELRLDVAGAPLTVLATVPREVLVRVPPPRPPPAWSFDLPVVVGGCVLPREAVANLAVRDVITIEPRLALEVGLGSVGLSAAPGAVEAAVTTGYVAREMPPFADDAQLELTVQLGTTRLALRQLAELSVGQVIPLGRPLAGPFAIHVAGRRVGDGELVDVAGEVGVRIVSLEE